MDSVYVVYRLVRTSGNEIFPPTEGLSFVRWTPSLLRVLPPGLLANRLGFVKNWVFHIPQLVHPKRCAYSVFALAKTGRYVTQCIITPSSRRFGFMQEGDIQIGLVYTDPRERNRRLAGKLIGAIVKRTPEGQTIWWLTEADNRASRAVAERAGFTLVGNAIRTTIFGFPVYRLADWPS